MIFLYFNSVIVRFLSLLFPYSTWYIRFLQACYYLVFC